MQLACVSSSAHTAESSGHYIDAREFTELFRKNATNRKRKIIAERIHLIAQNYVRRFSLEFYSVPEEGGFARRSHVVLEDAASEATLAAMKKIWHYTKRCDHRNAFLYFTKVIQYEVFNRLRVERNLARGLPAWWDKRRKYSK